MFTTLLELPLDPGCLPEGCQSRTHAEEQGGKLRTGCVIDMCGPVTRCNGPVMAPYMLVDLPAACVALLLWWGGGSGGRLPRCAMQGVGSSTDISMGTACCEPASSPR